MLRRAMPIATISKKRRIACRARPRRAMARPLLCSILCCGAALPLRQLSPIRGATVVFIPTVQTGNAWAKPLPLTKMCQKLGRSRYAVTACRRRYGPPDYSSEKKKGAHCRATGQYGGNERQIASSPTLRAGLRACFYWWGVSDLNARPTD